MDRLEFIQQDLEKAHRAFLAGNKFAALFAVQSCLVYKVAVPEWAAKYFIQAVQDIRYMKYKTANEAFGLPKWPKGKNVKAQREGIERAVPVWLRVCQLHNAGEAIGQELFEKVGAEFGIGKNRAAYYYKWAQALNENTRWALLIPYLANAPPSKKTKP